MTNQVKDDRMKYRNLPILKLAVHVLLNNVSSQLVRNVNALQLEHEITPIASSTEKTIHDSAKKSRFRTRQSTGVVPGYPWAVTWSHFCHVHIGRHQAARLVGKMDL